MSEIINHATMRIGIKSSEWEDLGTCFYAPIYSVSEPSSQYVITAYHVISEAYITGKQVFILDTQSDKFIAADVVVYPPSKSWQEGLDYAILKLNSNISSIPVICAKINKPAPVIIRGRPDGLETNFTSIRGFFNGIEIIKTGNFQVLEIRSEEFQSSSLNNTNEKSNHKIWRGISGSPIAIYDEHSNKSVCVIGFISRIAKDGLAGRAYGVPISIIEEACQSKGLTINLENYIDNVSASVTSEDLLIDICHLIDPIRENFWWNILSNLFYRGKNVESLIKNTISNLSKYNLELSDLVFLEYFLARFYFKMGKIRLAEETIHKSLEHAKNLDFNTKSRIQALAKARLVIESKSKNIEKKLKDFSEANNSIQELNNVSDQYISSESASLLGRHLTSLFITPGCFNNKQEKKVEELILEHNNLIKINPIYLAKQDIVNTALQCLNLLWKKNNRVNDDIFNLNSLGFQQAQKHKNSIFYIQMLFVKAIFLWIQGEEKNALCIFVLLGKIMRINNIKTSHEGIFQFLSYVNSMIPTCANIFDISLYNTSDNYLSLSEIANLYTTSDMKLRDAINIEVKARTWLGEIKNYHNLYEVPDRIFDN